MCYLFGERVGLFAEELTYELKFALYLNSHRIKSIIGSQVYKALFYVNHLRSYLDDDFCDAISRSEDGKTAIFNWFEEAYKRFAER